METLLNQKPSLMALEERLCVAQDAAATAQRDKGALREKHEQDPGRVADVQRALARAAEVQSESQRRLEVAGVGEG